MLALVRDRHHNPPVTLREVAEPEPNADEALIEVHASSVNRGELALLAARPDGWRPGQDIAGVVLRPAASGAGPAAGARVVGLVEDAGWSERVAAPVARLATLDDAVSFVDATTLGLAGRTALRTVWLAGPLLGRNVLVLGPAAEWDTSSSSWLSAPRPRDSRVARPVAREPARRSRRQPRCDRQ